MSESSLSACAAMRAPWPVAVDVLAGLVAQVLAYVTLVAAVLAGDADDPDSAGFVFRTAGLGAVVLALALGMAPVLRWSTLPLCLVGALVGRLVGARLQGVRAPPIPR